MMTRQTISLGRIWGIPIGVDYSWFLIFILITWTLAVSYYPSEFRDWPTTQYWIMGAVTAIMLFVSVLLHELGHSVVALRYNIPVRRITLFIFGGVAEIASEPPHAPAEFWIAVAGPVVSLGLALIFGVLSLLATGVEAFLALTKYLAYINGILVVFNLIPGFPLDGGRVFRAFIWGLTRSFRRATLIAASVGRFIAFLFIVLGVWQILSGNFGNGLWIAFIGWFLDSAASAQIRQQRIRDLLSGYTVANAMSPDYLAIPANTTVQQLVDHYILGGGRRYFIVNDNGGAAGLLTLHHIKEVSRDRWPEITAAEAMTPVDQLQQVQPTTELWAALAKMDRNGVNQMPVMDNGRIVGMLSRDSIIDFLRMVQELDT